ncbi:MAG: hypothetical protein FWD34_05295, partial [Oscillospiraceae bacterium]|nr:hypothetical protein [Oscillospiraceae bacterium]
VVIAIIGVLAAILIPTMLGYITSSRISSANSDASNIQTAVTNWVSQMDSKDFAIDRSSSFSITVVASNNSWTTAATVTDPIFLARPAAPVRPSASTTIKQLTDNTNDSWLAENLPNIGTGTAVVFFNAGACVAVAWFKNVAVEAAIQYDPNAAAAANHNGWLGMGGNNGKRDGQAGSGSGASNNIVGTYPPHKIT